LVIERLRNGAGAKARLRPTSDVEALKERMPARGRRQHSSLGSSVAPSPTLVLATVCLKLLSAFL